jgi:hypothetical protein
MNARHVVCRNLLALIVGWTVCFSTTVGKAEFTPIAGWDSQLFPSFVVATASVRPTGDDNKEGKPADDVEIIGDSHSIFGVELTSDQDANVKVTISCPAFLEPSVQTASLSAGKTVRVMPKMRYRYDRLAKNHQTVPTTFTYKVEVDGEEPEEKIVSITVRSINDCPFSLKEGDQYVDIGFTFAAYVNEQHPFVDKLLREALDGGIVNSFTGYQSDDPQEVLRQVYAVWHALSQRDMRYSSITTTAIGSQTVGSQNVRLIEESINNSQANCVDGAVLFASAIRKIGIETFLVMTPNHCYVGFYPHKQRKGTPLALETTMIGGDPADYAEIKTELDELIDEVWHETSSWRTFAAAVEVGTADYAKYGQKTDIDPNSKDWRQTIFISDCRKAGILPIPFNSTEEYQWTQPATEGDELVTETTEESETVESKTDKDDSDEDDDKEEDGDEDGDDDKKDDK